MPLVSRFPWFECPDNTRRSRQITKFIVTEIFNHLVTSLFSRLSTYNLSTRYQVLFSSNAGKHSGRQGCDAVALDLWFHTSRTIYFLV